ncbi:MAG: T9SS type A sorting domain-containing protein [Bacteroidota bacterium]
MKRIYAVMIMSIISMNLCCQIHWSKYPDNPVMVPGSAGEWDEGLIAPGSVLYHEGSYHMWYWGGDIGNVNLRIGHATSLDGITWSKDINNPVLEPGPDGTWEGTAVADPTVIFNDSIFHMWYEGTPTKSLSEGMQIGHATSPDGIHWTKDTNNPVLEMGTSGKWDDQWVSQPEVIYNGSEYHMWYGGDNRTFEKMSIGHATSMDGTTWTKDARNPVLISEASGDWDYPRVNFPKVIFDGTSFKMFYSGGDFAKWQIGCATSEDGSTWTKYVNNPLLSNGTNGTWDASFAAFTPVIDSAGVKFKMWYLGGSSVNSSGIGYAESNPIVTIPDTAFLHALIDEGVDTNGDSLISFTEAEAVTKIDVGRYCGGWAGCNRDAIKDMTGIEAFINLDTLNCRYNELESLDITNLSALIGLECGQNQLSSLDVSNCSALEFLFCGNNQLISLDVSNNTTLTRLSCGSNQLTSLDVSNNTKLGGSPYYPGLDCSNNQLTSLDVSNNTALTWLDCSDNQLTSLDVSNNTALTGLDCSETQLTSLDVSNNTALEYFSCQGNQLTNLDVSNNTALTFLHCEGSQLTSLDVSNDIALTYLDCSGNQLTSLDVSGCISLFHMNCSYNHLTSLDLSNNTALPYLDCRGNQLTSLDVSGCISLSDMNCSNNQLTSLDVSGCNALEILECEQNQITSLDVSNNTPLTFLSIKDCPTLYEVCVWTTPFPTGDIQVFRGGSPNVCFETDCNGVCENTGIEGFTKGTLVIYPNPTNTLLTIETEYPDHYSINITTLNGQQILSGEMEGTSYQIDLSPFPKGIYFITIRSQDFVTIRKIIKL